MCCVLSNKQLLKLINHQSGDEILSQFQILFIALPFFIKYPLVVVLCYKMNRTFLLLFYQTSQCHTLLSKHFGCLKIQDTSSSISKASLRKEKRITLAFKTYLSVVSCVTADFFFFSLCNIWDKNCQSRSDTRLMKASLLQLPADSTSCFKEGDKKFHS